MTDDRTTPRKIEQAGSRELRIEWADGKEAISALSPLALEELAQEVGKRFQVRAALPPQPMLQVAV